MFANALEFLTSSTSKFVLKIISAWGNDVVGFEWPQIGRFYIAEYQEKDSAVE